MVDQQPVDTTLSVLADPTRRAIVAMLAAGPRPAGELAAAFPVSKPAISRHLRLLREGQVIEERRGADDGRVRLYTLRREAFDQLDAWLDQVRRFWESQLDAFRSYVESERDRARRSDPGGDDGDASGKQQQDVP